LILIQRSGGNPRNGKFSKKIRTSEGTINIETPRDRRSNFEPRLSAGNGGLDWNIIKNMLLSSLKDLDCQITIYEPNKAVKEILKNERVALTPAPAMLLSVVSELVKNGKFISEF